MATLTAPITIGTASASATHAADLGKLILIDGKMYRVVKSTGALAAAAKKFVVSAVLAGQPTWSVALGTVAVDAYKFKHRALVPAGQVGSTGTTGLVAGDYFLAQVSGPAQALCAAGLAAGGSHNLVVNTLGQVKVATLTTIIAGRASPGFSTHTAATTIAGATIGFVLAGLV